jgi:hypothetical protein
MDIKELVDLCKKGNEQALSLLYKTYSKKMMRIFFLQNLHILFWLWKIMMICVIL